MKTKLIDALLALIAAVALFALGAAYALKF